MKRQDILENQAKIVFLGIGSNLGIRKRNIEKAKFLLAEHNLDVLSVSSYYETPSWPDPQKPKFLNIILKLKCNYSPQELLKICKTIETQLGRKKSKKNAPRICDLDIIDYNKLVSKKNAKINLPHKRMHKRSFVLFPLFEIQKNWIHPDKQIDVKTLISLLPDRDIRSIKQIWFSDIILIMLNSNELINKVKNYNKFLNPEKLDKAYNFAVKAHKSQKRASGDPYSVHPIEVANILTELKLDSATITTGLLHDTIEDTFATYETIKQEFGDEVADLVDGVTKISAFENSAGANSKVENFRKLILATSKDIRVLLVKIADRLHNMRTIKAITKEDKRKRIAQETMEIYAPLADRMGMHRIRDELEDLSFEILNNDARKLIKKRLDEIKLDRKDLFEEQSFELSEILNDNEINAEIHGREKTPFSIWRKVQKKRVSLEQITDIIGFRIILKNVDDCYKTLGIFHKKWNCIPGKFKDYISSPKINGYKSIHTSVIGSNKKPIEIQIRTHEMHEFAERGVASHWQYKSSEKFNSLSWKEYDWLKDLVEIIEKNENPEDSYEYTKLQMFQENVFCFTPKGSVIKLPKDATAIDFAYAVHTKIGNSAVGCEINGNKNELQTILRNGDRVNIITSKNNSPSLHWIPTTKTGKARAAIRRYWHDKGEQKEEKTKKYNTTLWMSLPDKPGQLGDISSLIGSHKLNISSLEMVGKNPNYINFKFKLIIRNLKNFTNFIAELKQKSIKFKIIRHEEKRNAFTQKILKYFKKN